VKKPVISIIQIQIQIFILVAVGFIAGKKGIFSPEARRDMTNVVIYIILPCNIFQSFEKSLTPDKLAQCAIVFVIAMGSQLLYMLINKVAYNRFPIERRVVMKYATIVNNASFMGLPVIGSVFGSTGILYGSIVLVPLRLFMWTSGLSLFTKTQKKKQFKSLATHPCIWAVILGFAYLFSPVRLPSFLSDTIGVVGSCITFTTMFIVGSILSEVNLRTVLDKACFYYSFIRLIAIPAVTFAVLRLIGIDPVVTGVAVLSSAMPAATMTAMLAQKYGQDSAFASKLIFVSTLLSLVTLPLITAVLKGA
jgi:predicted permease